MDGAFLRLSKHGEISPRNFAETLNLTFYNMKNLIFVEIGWGEIFFLNSYWE